MDQEQDGRDELQQPLLSPSPNVKDIIAQTMNVYVCQLQELKNEIAGLKEKLLTKNKEDTKRKKTYSKRNLQNSNRGPPKKCKL